MLLDLTNVKASTGGGGTLPEGEYVAFIDTAELKTTKTGDGQYIKTMWKVADGQHKNRTIFQNYNIKAKSEQAQQIGLADLKKVLEVNERTTFQIQSVSELLGLKALVYVKVKAQQGYADTNVITGYKTTGKKTTTTTGAATGFHQGATASVPGL